MKHRFSAAVVVSAAAAMVGTAPALADSRFEFGQEQGVNTGGVKGRITVDGKPVPKGNPASVRLVRDLDPSATDFEGADAADSKGRFFIAGAAVDAPLYLTMSIYMRSREVGATLNCKASGYTFESGELAPIQYRLSSSAPVPIEVGKVITRNIKLDCKPNALVYKRAPTR